MQEWRLPEPSAAACDRLQQHLPQLQVFLDQRLSLAERYAESPEVQPKTELVQLFNRAFGRLLLALCRFRLYAAAEQEMVAGLTFMQSRGSSRQFVEHALQSWIMGVRTIVPRPLCDELVPALQWFRGRLDALYQQVRPQVPQPEEGYRQFCTYVLNKNRKFAAEAMLTRLRDGASIEQVYSSMLLPTLRHIDALWLHNSFSVADEHAATDICRYVMFRVIDNVFGERRYPFRAMVCCLPDERHSLPAEILANYLEISGWTVYFIGRLTSTDEIMRAVQKNRPQAVVLAAETLGCLPALHDVLQTLRTNVPDTALFAGGRAAIAAQALLAHHVNAVLDGLQTAHETMLATVMPDA